MPSIVLIIVTINQVEVNCMQFLSKSYGTGGSIKSVPEDFVVKEITSNGTVLEPGTEYTANELGEQPGAEPKFTRMILQKRNWDTVGALTAMSKKLGRGRKSFSYSGTKDRASISVQLVSIFGVEPLQLSGLRIKDISINGAWKGDAVELGSNVGNAFEAIVRSPEHPDSSTQIISELGGRFPNYFDRQRFGYRLNNFRVGRLILENRIQDAAMAFLTDTANEDNKDAVEARKKLADEQDFKAALLYFPRYLKYERTVIEYMSRYDNFANALRKLPRGILMLFIHAVESGMFNAVLEKRLINEDTDSKVYCERNFYGFPDSDKPSVEEKNGFAAMPILGYETQDRYIGEYESEAMERFGITRENFKIKWMPELSMKGSFRALLAPVKNLSCNACDAGQKLKFEIPSGSYATILINEITKTDTASVDSLISS